MIQNAGPDAVLRLMTELRRQASRPRTRIALACMVALPLIILIAFEFGGGGDDDNNGSGATRSLVDLATAGGANFALFTLLVSSSFLLVVVFALFFGDTVASEASWGSLRYLLAIPVPRARLLGGSWSVGTLRGAGAGAPRRHGTARRDDPVRLEPTALDDRGPAQRRQGDGPGHRGSPATSD